MVTPDFKCFMDGKEFLVVRIIVPFSGAERPRMEGNRVELSIGSTPQCMCASECDDLSNI